MLPRHFATLTILAFFLFSPQGTLGAGTAPECDEFPSWEWAQSTYDMHPETLAHLAPAGSDIACPDLPRGGIVPALWTDRIPTSAEQAQLDAIVDGDTFYAQTATGRERIRMYHIDSPEAGSFDQPAQCGATESTRVLGSIFGQVPDDIVYLEYDETQRDQYDRRLAYVWFEHGGEAYMINEIMVRAGWADSETFPPDDRYKPQIDDAAAFAERHRLGVHHECGGFDLDVPPTPSPTSHHADAGSTQDTGDCDPAYPTVCIPPQWQVGDLDCGDIPFRRFEVLPPDSHRFDGNHDGVGCEGP